MRDVFSALLIMSAGITSMHAADIAGCVRREDIRIDAPGLKVEKFLPALESDGCAPNGPAHASVADLRCIRWSSQPAIDADGAIYFMTLDLGLGLPPQPSVIWRTRRDGKTEMVAHIDPITVPPGVWASASFEAFLIDSARGDLIALLRCTCLPSEPTQICPFRPTSEVVRIVGLPRVKHESKSDAK